jgi:hypothetical protein
MDAMTAEEYLEYVTRATARMEAAGLADPFKGVTTDSEIVPGLYSISSTGVSTEPVRVAAQAFLDALNAEQRARTQYAVDDPE